MVNYAYGKIYKITSESTGLVYYGSTAQYYLSKRLSGHLKSYKRYLNGKNKSYMTSFKLLECEDYNIQLVKDFSCANKRQLTTEEAKYIRENKCVNKIIPDRTAKEYSKKYKEEHKEHIKERDRQYKEKNKETIKQNKKEWYQANKSKIKEQESKPYECKCGSTIIWGNKAIHFKTKKHCQFINNL